MGNDESVCCFQIIIWLHFLREESTSNIELQQDARLDGHKTCIWFSFMLMLLYFAFHFFAELRHYESTRKYSQGNSQFPIRRNGYLQFVPL
jgi:hypothetical protein